MAVGACCVYQAPAARERSKFLPVPKTAFGQEQTFTDAPG